MIDQSKLKKSLYYPLLGIGTCMLSNFKPQEWGIYKETIKAEATQGWQGYFPVAKVLTAPIGLSYYKDITITITTTF